MSIKALEGRTFSTRPPRGPTRQNYFGVVTGRLFEGLENQTLYLGCSGEHRAPKGRKWYSIIDRLYYCRIEVAGRSMVLDPATGKKWVIFGSAEEACQWYSEVFEAVNSGEMNEMITEHLASIRPRQRRTNGGTS